MFEFFCKMYLCLFAKGISTNCKTIFVLICRRYLYFLQEVFALVCKKYFPFSREASCMLCNAGCQDLPCGKTLESRDCLFDTLTPSFPPELWYKNFLNISHSLLLWILHIIQREVRILHLLNCIYWICC